MAIKLVVKMADGAVVDDGNDYYLARRLPDYPFALYRARQRNIDPMAQLYTSLTERAAITDFQWGLYSLARGDIGADMFSHLLWSVTPMRMRDVEALGVDDDQALPMLVRWVKGSMARQFGKSSPWCKRVKVTGDKRRQVLTIKFDEVGER